MVWEMIGEEAGAGTFAFGQGDGTMSFPFGEAATEVDFDRTMKWSVISVPVARCGGD